MTSQPVKSPDKLEIKGKPPKGKYFGKKAAFLGGSIIGGALLAVIYGISSREPTGTNSESDAAKGALVAATEQSKKVYANVPDSIANTQRPANAITDTGATTVSTQAASSPSNIPNLPAPQNVDTASQRLKEQREQELLKALSSDTDVSKWSNLNNVSSPIGGSFQNPASNMQSQENPAIAAINAAAKQIAGDNDQNKQSRKEAFLAQASTQPDSDYLLQTVKLPIAKYEIKATTVIPATLITGINSDLPGDIFAQVKEDVYDTASGRYLLIPKGTRLYGSYDSQVAYAQERLLVTWTRLIYPDGSSINIGGMTGGDKGGYAGFKDQVNNHYGRLIGAGLLTSLFSAGFQLSQPQNNNNNNQLTPQQVAAASVGQQMSMLGIKVTEKNLNIQPTIEIRPGYEFVVKVAKDIVFPSPYTGKRS